MIGNYSARLTGSKRNLLALLASSVIFSAGCANMSSTAPAGNPFSSPATLSGKIHGGNQPVIGATVNLWFAGQSSTAVQAATTTTDSTGSFSFTRGADNGTNSGTTDTYSCPTTGSGANPLVYVVSKGGNTQNDGGSETNSAAAFIAVYGLCSNLSASNFVYMSEVTSVATMAAVQQFFNPANDNITADGTGQQKIIITNLTNTIGLLANPTTGLYVPATTIPATTGGSIASSVSLTATPEPGKVNLLANIISACINAATSADPNCTTLFSAATPPTPNTTNLNGGTFPTATDTLQALFYIFTNPSNGSTTNLATLYGLAGGVGAPYQPSASQPTDWTIGISYTSTSTCGTSTGGTGSFISSPNDVNIDALDNVWFGNAQTGGNLSGISASGAPLYCVNFDAGTSASGGTVDSAANVWSAGGTTMYRYNPTTRATLAFPVGVAPLAITADGAGNVYFSAVSGSTGSVYQIPGAASASAAVTPLQISNTVGASPMRLMADASSTTPTTTPGNIWVSSGSTFISQLQYTTSTGAGIMNGFLTISHTTSGNSYGISVSHPNSVFVSSMDNGKIDQFVEGSGTWAPAGGSWPFTASTAGISTPLGIATDGRVNTWIPNNGASSVSEISFFGPNPISPSTGYQKASSYLNASTVLAVDQAGNVWIAGTGNNFVTEIVGGGVPIYTPYAVGINNGRFQKIP